MQLLIKILTFIFLIETLNGCDFYGGDVMKNDQVVCGGIVDKSYDAPKFIQSKNLSSVDTEFVYTEKFGIHDHARLNITLRRNEQNELILSEQSRYKVSVKVDDDVLTGVQKIIEKFNLAELNGKYRYTSGLPFQYMPIYFKAEYADGEKIYFFINGNPDELWCNELAEYFLNTFAKYGEKSVLPPK